MAEQPALRPTEATPFQKGGGLRKRRRLAAWAFMAPLGVAKIFAIPGPSVATVCCSFTE